MISKNISKLGVRRSDAVHVGPAWLRRHGYELHLRREAADTQAKRGNERLYFDAWPRPGEGEYIRNKYTTGEVAISTEIVPRNVRTNITLLYAARASPATHDHKQGIARDMC